jgi:hypothetical protein
MRPQPSDEPVMSLDLPFKGNRQYLHGTDIFDAVIPLTKPRHGVAFRFHSLMRNPIDLVPVVGTSEGGAAGFYVRYEDNGAKSVWQFRENLARRVTGRVPYDESDVVSDAVYGDDHIESPGPSPYSFIERTVALHKALLRRRADGEGQGAWLFTHLDLTRVPSSPKRIRLKLSGFLGTKMAKSTIECDGEALGQITFWRVSE